MRAAEGGPKIDLKAVYLCTNDRNFGPNSGSRPSVSDKSGSVAAFLISGSTVAIELSCSNSRDRAPHGQTRAAALGGGAPSEAPALSRRRRDLPRQAGQVPDGRQRLGHRRAPLGGAGTQTRDAGPVLRRGPAAAAAARRARGLCRHVGTLRAEPAGPPAPRAPRLRQVPRPAACERRRRRDAAGRVLPQGRRGPRPAPGQALVAPAPLGAPRTGGAAPGQGTAGPQPPAPQGVPAKGTARSSLGLHL